MSHGKPEGYGVMIQDDGSDYAGASVTCVAGKREREREEVAQAGCTYGLACAVVEVSGGSTTSYLRIHIEASCGRGGAQLEGRIKKVGTYVIFCTFVEH